MKAKQAQPPEKPEELVALIGEVAEQEGVEVYAVGGYVRDRLLGLPFREDIDFTVVGDGPAFAKAVHRHLGLRGQTQIYRRFGTAAMNAGRVRLEFATSRRESYSPESRNPVVEPAPLAEDLARRDFTVNALAVDTRDLERLIDHFGGLKDLDARTIRTPLDPEKTFRDDPLRILRAIRFAARLHFDIEEKTYRALRAERERLAIISRERINDEFFKILACDPPSRGLLMLHDTGVLEVIFPELAALAGVEQVGKHHHKDVLLHTFQVLDKLAEKTGRTDLRFAALMHDIGKPKTKRFEPGDGWTFHGHEHVGERMVRRMGKRYKWSDKLTHETAHLVRLHMRPINLQDEEVTDSAIRRLMVQAGEQLEDLLLLCRADLTSANPKKVRRYLKAFDDMVDRIDQVEHKDALRAFQSPIRGDEIMARTGLSEGPRVGLIKALIEEAILEGAIDYSREAAEEYFATAEETVRQLPDKEVLTTLRQIMHRRASGAGESSVTGASPGT